MSSSPAHEQPQTIGDQLNISSSNPLISTTMQPLDNNNNNNNTSTALDNDVTAINSNSKDIDSSPVPLTLSQIAAFQEKIISTKIGLEQLPTSEKATYVNEYVRCEKIKNDALSSRKVRFLFNSLAELNNVIFNPEKFVQCVHCDEPLNAFALITPENKSIIGICQNFIKDEVTTQNSVVHELVHIYDQTRAHVDLNNCIHVACTETRAAALSGECTQDREQERGLLSPFQASPGHFKQCVWRKAMNSLKFQPLCNQPEVCEKAMKFSFDRCLSDQSPFYALPE